MVKKILAWTALILLPGCAASTAHHLSGAILLGFGAVVAIWLCMAMALVIGVILEEAGEWVLGVVFIGALLTYCSTAKAADGVTDGGTGWHLMSLEKVQLSGYRLINYRDPYYSQYHDMGSGQPGETWDKGAAVLWDVDIVKYGDYGLRWDNRVHGESTDRQFRSVGWEYTLSLGKRDALELYYAHHSQHVLDSTQQGTYTGFPLVNEVGVLWTMYKREGK